MKTFIKDLSHKIRNFKERLKWGLGCCDLFSYDHYIAERIGKDLIRFKKANFSHPCNMTEEEWDNIIQEISDGLLAVSRIDDENLNLDESIKAENKARKERQKAIKLFAKYLNDFWI